MSTVKHTMNVATLTLWPADKNGNQRAPDMKGSCYIGDKKYKCAAWWNEDEGGKRLSVSVRYEDGSQPAAK